MYRAAFALLVAAALVHAQSITVDGNKLTVRTPTVEVSFDGPVVTSIRPAGRDIEFVHPTVAGVGLDLLYLNGELLGVDKHQQITVRKVSDVAVRIEVTGEDSRRTLLVAIDPDTNDVRLIPDGLSSRRGLRAVRWTVALHPETTAILPCINGMQFSATSPLPHNQRFPWPFEWNAQLAIAQRGNVSMMIHCEDKAYQFKALQFTRNGDRIELGFDSEPPGSLWDNRTAGGIEWRLNVYGGDWQVPATRYRRWMEAAYDLADKHKHRPDWVKDITFVQCWADPSEAMLDALAAAHPPQQTLIHLANWRTEKYDVMYPDYTPREDVLKYMAKARAMGFHVMPHFNYFACYYKHPFFQEARDFQLRTVDKNQPDGWHWPPDTHDYTRMGYIHPGAGIWRSKLIDVLLDASQKVGTDVAFIDQTLCTWNTDNGLVQGMNTIEGMRQLQEEFAAVRPDFVLVGEGLNEISFQRECFAQAHIYQGWSNKLTQANVDLAHPINSFLWGDHTKLIGYHCISPGGPVYEFGIGIYERMGALPTIVTNNAKDIQEMSPLTQRIFDRAKGKPTTQP